MSTTRRQFLRASSAGVAASVLAPQSVLFPGRGFAAHGLRGGRFSEGVVAGDPTTRSIALWTRVAHAEGSGRVTLEVARERNFNRVVARKDIPTSGSVNHAVKAQVSGLKPHTEYFYRFSTGSDDSDVGRFRTAAPADSNEPVRFAFWSCQDYAHGYFNAHDVLAEQDLDFMVCLGDYIYAETYHSRHDGTGVRDDRIGRASRDPSHIREAVSLDDYREKYSLYRTDAALRRIHRRFPMVYIPDDHEVQDNWAGAPVNGGLGPSKQFSPARKRAARKAFFESNPRFPRAPRLYRSLSFGRTVELFVMDQRSYRDNQPCGDAVTPPCADWSKPRDFLGRRQLDWVKDGLSASRASWKVMANEVMIMPTIALNDSFLNFDSWQGYPGEREELIAHIRDKQIKDVIFATGDIHTFIAGDVQPGFDGKSPSVAIELVGGSVTSQGLGEIDLDAGGGVTLKGNDKHPHTDPALINTLRGINPWVDIADFDHHGFAVVEATKDEMKSKFIRMQTIKTRTRKTLSTEGFSYTIRRGQTSIKGVNGPKS